MTAGYGACAMRSARSLLFVPGNRPERFEKAVAAQADIVILDLEDAVAAEDKAAARARVSEWFAAGNPGMVRINASNTLWHADNLELIREHRVPVMVAKAESPEQLHRMIAAAPRVPVVPLIGTAAAVLSVTELCAVPGVARVAFGSIDFANQIGVDPGRCLTQLSANARSPSQPRVPLAARCSANRAPALRTCAAMAALAPSASPERRCSMIARWSCADASGHPSTAAKNFRGA